MKAAKSNGYTGRAMKRVEDPRLIKGIASYVDDMTLPGMLHTAILRSPYAHAKINGIKTDAARALPGVVGVFTGADVNDKCGVVPCATPMPAVTDPEKALEKNAPLTHPELGTNQAYTWSLANGDLTKAFKQAGRVIKQRMIHQRLTPMAIEPRGCIASFHAGEGTLTLWTSTQIPHLVRTLLPGMIGVAENKMRIVAPEVGGGFGSKLNLYAEEALCSHLAMRLGAPVKWIESRRENASATIHGRDQIGDYEIAVKKDGTLLAIKSRTVADLGFYFQLLTPAIPTLTGLMLTGCYKCKAVRMDVVGVWTNKMATDAYRGAGRPEATYLIERVMDLVADELKLDPVKVRLKNFPKPTEFPFPTPTGLTDRKSTRLNSSH